MRTVTQIAAAAGVKRLILTHHDPTHDDAFLTDVETRAQDLARSIRFPMLGLLRPRRPARNRSGTMPFDETESPRSRTPTRAAADRCWYWWWMTMRTCVFFVRKALTHAGHEVLEADNGEEGLRLIEAHAPDLVLLDLNMPGMDGFEVLQALRSRETGRSLPVIVLTGLGDEESARRSFQFGATDFLVKPFSPPQLDVRVRACFAHAGKQ